MNRLIILLFISFQCLSQEDTLHFTLRGTLTYIEDRYPAPLNTPVYLVTRADTVEIAFTDSLGNFKFLHKPQKSAGKYDLFSGPKYNNSTKIDLTNLNYSQDFVIDMALLESRFQRRPDLSVYFQKNEFRDFSNYKASWFKELLDEYPNLCIEFSVTQFRDEPRRLAKKRMKTFQKALIQEGVAEDRYMVSDTIYYLSDDPGKYWMYLPAVQGKVISLEGCR